MATPYPCALLIRPETLLVNLEAVRMIVCRDHCYVLSVPDAESSPHGKFASHECVFVNDLTSRILHTPQRCAAASPLVLCVSLMRSLPI